MFQRRKALSQIKKPCLSQRCHLQVKLLLWVVFVDDGARVGLLGVDREGLKLELGLHAVDHLHRRETPTTRQEPPPTTKSRHQQDSCHAGKTAGKGRLSCSKTVPFFSKTLPFLALPQSLKLARSSPWQVLKQHDATRRTSSALLESRSTSAMPSCEGQQYHGERRWKAVKCDERQCRNSSISE